MGTAFDQNNQLNNHCVMVNIIRSSLLLKATYKFGVKCGIGKSCVTAALVWPKSNSRDKHTTNKCTVEAPQQQQQRHKLFLWQHTRLWKAWLQHISCLQWNGFLTMYRKAAWCQNWKSMRLNASSFTKMEQKHYMVAEAMVACVQKQTINGKYKHSAVVTKPYKVRY